ncbi:SCAMP2 isoform 3 [Pan troglodytes]|uniref:SCAMP2 isoform 3 n=1 Tax=Pan troglodytes TaxID=9598 RepID=A0A2J8KRY0_PANTR|nr:SCAMP2 isoform 3 [Pan troglodytes]
MSAFDTNPFADPVDVNPFQDPSVTQLTNVPQGGLAEFNPFSEPCLHWIIIPWPYQSS